jgi:hypothetical protein
MITYILTKTSWIYILFLELHFLLFDIMLLFVQFLAI